MRSLLLTLAAAALTTWLLSFFIPRLHILTVPLVLLTVIVAGCPLDIWEMFGLRSGICLDMVWYFLKLVNVVSHFGSKAVSLWAAWSAVTRPWMMWLLAKLHELRTVHLAELLKTLREMEFR